MDSMIWNNNDFDAIQEFQSEVFCTCRLQKMVHKQHKKYSSYGIPKTTSPLVLFEQLVEKFFWSYVLLCSYFTWNFQMNRVLIAKYCNLWLNLYSLTTRAIFYSNKSVETRLFLQFILLHWKIHHKSITK